MKRDRLVELFSKNPLLACALVIQRPFFRGRLMKVGFPIVDESGELVGREWMWCRRVGFDLFTIDNIPEHASYAALGDLVSAGWSRDGWLFIDLKFKALHGQGSFSRNSA